MSPQGYENMDLESQDPIFNANLGQDENLIWTKKLTDVATPSSWILGIIGGQLFDLI